MPSKSFVPSADAASSRQAPALDVAAVTARLRSAMAEAGVDQARFASRAGVPFSTVRAYLSGRRLPSAEFLAGLHAAYGINPVWLLTGESPMQRADQAPAIGWHRVDGVNEPTARYGPGHALRLPEDWLAARELKPEALCVVTVDGNAMEPALRSGDLVVIHLKDTVPRSGFMYALVQGPETLVRLCQRLPDGLIRVSSANPAYPAFDLDLEATPAVTVLGRVVASLRDWC